MKNTSKSKVFIGSLVTLEFENVCAVYQTNDHCLDILLFGNHSISMTIPEEIANFKLWYGIYLEDKFGSEDQEDISGADVL